MANKVQWDATGVSRSTGIAAADTFLTATGLLSSEVDNSTILDRWMDLVLAFDPNAAAPAAGAPFYIYILYAMDGTNYEDGGVGLLPMKSPVAVIPSFAVATAQKMTVEGIQIRPFKFKILLWNATAITLDDVTLLAYTYNEEVQ